MLPRSILQDHHAEGQCWPSQTLLLGLPSTQTCRIFKGVFFEIVSYLAVSACIFYKGRVKIKRSILRLACYADHDERPRITVPHFNTFRDQVIWLGAIKEGNINEISTLIKVLSIVTHFNSPLKFNFVNIFSRSAAYCGISLEFPLLMKC